MPTYIYECSNCGFKNARPYKLLRLFCDKCKQFSEPKLIEVVM
jgi:predicted nucleic acid-binding Zn ribbon protein